MHTMKILAIIVTYYPSKRLLVKNVRSFVDNVDKLLIWENTPQETKYSYRFIEESEKIQYCGENENKGISYALNFAWQYAKRNGYDYLLTMDQDSYWAFFDDFLYSVKKFVAGGELGIWAPCHSPVYVEDEYLLSDHVITSGTLVPISILDVVGGYNTDFFVDGIDVDLCYRASEAGYKSYYVNNCFLIQRFGDRVSKCIFFRIVNSSNYSPFRLYGILRNHIIIMRKYNIVSSLRKRIIGIYIIRFTIKILLVEKNKWEKIKAILSGIYDGIRIKL